jgi:hypothetical protein
MYREFGIPARIEKPKTREELEVLIEKYNGKKSCYTSVYAFDDDKGYESAYINTIWFDFDHKRDINKCLKDVRKFYNRYCKPNNITPRIYLTGGKGFQMNIDFYSFLDIPPTMKRRALKEYLMYLKKKYFLSTLDERCINNSVSCMRRIPNTQYVSNLTGESTGIWCTQFSVKDMLRLSIEEMYAIAMEGPNEVIEIERSKRAQRDMLDFICALYNVPSTVSNSADYLYSQLYKEADKILKESKLGMYPSRESGLTLDLDKLENVKKRSGKIIARCPACAERGRDSQGNHLVIFDNGAYSCIVGDAKHRRKIYRLARKALNTSKE